MSWVSLGLIALAASSIVAAIKIRNLENRIEKLEKQS